LIYADCIKCGPLIGASQLELMKYIPILSDIIGKKIIIRDDYGYNAYFLSFIAEKVVCLCSENILVRNKQFFRSPNLTFVLDSSYYCEKFDLFLIC